MLKRYIEKDLKQWLGLAVRLPILIRGPRQVGKTYTIEKFGREHFESVVSVNFEQKPLLKTCFDSLVPTEIINKLQLLTNQAVVPDKTLLFLDEIQECPKAILALRYFKEQLPTLHVIGAGSLLEFALRSEDFRMPVGRVQFMFMKPLSFLEFLEALGRDALMRYCSHLNLENPVDMAVHHQLLELVRLYFILGGMPAVVQEYCLGQDLLRCQQIQTGLLQSYQSDFAKYGPRVNYRHVQQIFQAAPRLAGQRFKYVHVDPHTRSRDLKNAMELLELAGVVKSVYSSAASGLPLGAQINAQKFKLLFLDIGLLQNACGLQAQLAVGQDIASVAAGAAAEQFAGQELLAYQDSYAKPEIFFWSRESRNSSAEVDYVIPLGDGIAAIEVKSGRTGTLRSLQLFLKEKRGKVGIKISSQPLSLHEGVLSVPFYMIGHLERLCRSL